MNVSERWPIRVNGEPHLVAPATTAAALIEALGLKPEAVALAINAEFVPRARRAERVLAAGDEVTCFQAIVGG